jgi:RNA polymerase sigma-70 factor (ECF subfamily)
MSVDPLENLLERLNKGDDAAAEELFVNYEPYLRIVVRRMLPTQLRSKFDSIDVVQSVWGDLLKGFRDAGWRFASPAHLKAFLIKATRNRFLSRQRRYRSQIEHEMPLNELDAVSTSEPIPEDLAQADELWQRLLALCSPAQQQLLDLKRQGFTLDEIAERTGYHPSSIRRIFYDLIREITPKDDAPPAQDSNKA